MSQAKRMIESKVTVNWSWVLDDQQNTETFQPVDFLIKEYIGKGIFSIPEELLPSRQSSPLTSLSSRDGTINLDDGKEKQTERISKDDKKSSSTSEEQNGKVGNDQDKITVKAGSGGIEPKFKVYLLLLNQQEERNLSWDKNHFLLSPSQTAIPTKTAIQALGDAIYIKKRLGRQGLEMLSTRACISFGHRFMASLDQPLVKRPALSAPLGPIETPLDEIPIADNTKEDGKLWLTLRIKKFTERVDISWHIFDQRGILKEEFFSDLPMLQCDIDVEEPLVSAKRILMVAAQETELFKGPMMLMFNNPANKGFEEPLAQRFEEIGAFEFIARRDAELRVIYVDIEEVWTVQVFIKELITKQKKRSAPSQSPPLNKRPTARSESDSSESSSDSETDSNGKGPGLGMDTDSNNKKPVTKTTRAAERNAAVEAWLLNKYRDDEVVKAIRGGSRRASEPISVLSVWIKKVAEIVCDEVDGKCMAEGAAYKKVTRTNIDHLLKKGKSWVTACIAAQNLIDRGVADKDEMMKMALDPTKKDMTPMGATSLLKALQQLVVNSQ